MLFIHTALRGLVFSLLFSVLCTETLIAQKTDAAITEEEKKQIIEKTFTLLHDYYIFPEIVDSMEFFITQKLNNGKYVSLASTEDFLAELNFDLETLSNDRHVNIFLDPVRVKQIKLESESEPTKPEFDPEFLKRAQYENYKVRKVERLDGNIGYLKLDLFVDIKISKPTLISAMNFLSNSWALVIDLRQNGGGNASTVNFLINYFLPDSTLTCQFESRLTKTTTLVYTQHDALIQKFSDTIPIYILVSKRTSSAAEAFAYTLQSFKRATIIGDTTNGEANPGYAFAVNDKMLLMVPTSINRNFVTNTNWQGTGVIPDIVISSDKAIYAAQCEAYKYLQTNSDNEEMKRMYDWLSIQYKAQANPFEIDKLELASYVGEYADNRKITLDQGKLFYERVDGSERKNLIPLEKDLFELQGSAFFRVRFIKDGNGNVVALQGMYDDGFTDVSPIIDNSD